MIDVSGDEAPVRLLSPHSFQLWMEADPMAKPKHRAAEIAAAVRESHSFAGALRRLNLRVAGGNYPTLKQAIRDMNLDVSHWTGQGHRKGSTVPVVRPRPLSVLLRPNTPVSSSKFRKRLIREKLLEERCSRCMLTQWLEQPISLELDHIDGDRYNQELSNLRLLCPNCHAQTPTYRGRNRKGRTTAKLLDSPSAMMTSAARVVKSVDTRDLNELSPPGETPEVTPVKVGEGPGYPS